MKYRKTLVKLAAAAALGIGALGLPALGATAAAGPPAHVGTDSDCFTPYQLYLAGMAEDDCINFGAIGRYWGWWGSYYCHPDLETNTFSLCYHY